MADSVSLVFATFCVCFLPRLYLTAFLRESPRLLQRLAEKSFVNYVDEVISLAKACMPFKSSLPLPSIGISST